MDANLQRFELRLARTPKEIMAAQRLRYRVFVEEHGASAAPEDRIARLERDQFDPYFDHLLLIDKALNVTDPLDQIIGVYRLMRGATARSGVGFYSAHEYDLDILQKQEREVLELGRSCLHAEYRGGIGMHLLWSGLAAYVARHNIGVLFGVASFHGTDVVRLAQPLSYLHYNHLAPSALRVRAVKDHFVDMARIPVSEIDRRTALLATPALIKAYIRLGGYVGEGAFIDHEFNTVDVCLVMDTDRMKAKARQMYTANPIEVIGL